MTAEMVLYLLYCCRDDLSKLEYITLCLKESLRLCPPVFAIGRKMSKNVTFDGHVVPAGMFIIQLKHA